jgi:hypothetical protein
LLFENYLKPTKTSRERNNDSAILKIALICGKKEHLLLMRLFSCEKIDQQKEQGLCEAFLENVTPTLLFELCIAFSLF